MEDGKKEPSGVHEYIRNPDDLLLSVYKKMDFLEVVKTLSSEVSNCSGEVFQVICDNSEEIDQPMSLAHPKMSTQPMLEMEQNLEREITYTCNI